MEGQYNRKVRVKRAIMIASGGRGEFTNDTQRREIR
jgi:hypothetical protein